VRPYYEADGVTIYHADCVDVLPHLKADLCVTSPPYNLGGKPWANLGNWKPGDSKTGQSKWRNGSDGVGGIQYADHSDAMPWEQYVAWQRQVISLLWQAVGESGAVFYNHKPRVIGAKLWLPLELLPPEVVLRQIIVWARPGGLNFNPTAFLPSHEWVMLLAKPEFRLKSRAAAGTGGGDVWRMSPEPSVHPAPFPLALPTNAIEPTDAATVLDPFAGSGTTLVAAKKLGRRAIGIEKDEAYCEMAAKRFEQGTFDLGGVA
jgi:site-specific DNA-methyltransferase (adenine-specific)